MGRVKQAEKWYWEGRRIERELGSEKHLGINRVMASMYQCMGQHSKAIPFLDEALESNRLKHKPECHFLRAACYHAIGLHSNAVRDYLCCMEYEKSLEKDDEEERRQMMYLAFYQKEMALYLRHQLDVPVSEFCMDIDLPPIFKVEHDDLRRKGIRLGIVVQENGTHARFDHEIQFSKADKRNFASSTSSK